jgi:hypothetical protein
MIIPLAISIAPLTPKNKEILVQINDVVLLQEKMEDVLSKNLTGRVRLKPLLLLIEQNESLCSVVLRFIIECSLLSRIGTSCIFVQTIGTTLSTSE